MRQLGVGNQDQVKAKCVVYLIGKQARTLPMQDLVVGMIDVHDVRAHTVPSFKRLYTSENMIKHVSPHQAMVLTTVRV